MDFFIVSQAVNPENQSKSVHNLFLAPHTHTHTHTERERERDRQTDTYYSTVEGKKTSTSRTAREYGQTSDVVAVGGIDLFDSSIAECQFSHPVDAAAYSGC